MPEHYWHPGARRDYLAEWGADGTILFPNWELTWARLLRNDPESLKVNMEAWNRWAVTVSDEGRGRLYPVGDVMLDDLEWAEAQLRALARGGVRVVKVPQGLAGGKRVIIASARGGIYSDAAGKASDFQEAYLRRIFEFIGVDNPEFVRAEGLNLGAAQRDAAMAKARRQIEGESRVAA